MTTNARGDAVRMFVRSFSIGPYQLISSDLDKHFPYDCQEGIQTEGSISVNQALFFKNFSRGSMAKKGTGSEGNSCDII